MDLSKKIKRRESVNPSNNFWSVMCNNFFNIVTRGVILGSLSSSFEQNNYNNNHHRTRQSYSTRPSKSVCPPTSSENDSNGAYTILSKCTSKLPTQNYSSR